MKYIIMCGGYYETFETPRQLIEIQGEPIVARTVRLLKEQGIEEIYISSNNDIFKQYAELLKHENNFKVFVEDGKIVRTEGWWVEAFYPTNEPTTYLFGDVVYSPEAIKTIVETETDDFEFFASAPPYSEYYFKPYQEPFAFKIVNTDHFKQAIEDCKLNYMNGLFWRHPISWELWTTLRRGRMKKRVDVYKGEYTVINDYTIDIDTPADVLKLEKIISPPSAKIDNIYY